MAAIAWQILEQVQILLQAADWTPETGDTIKAIKDSAIVIRKSQTTARTSPMKSVEEVPGIIITLGDDAQTPAEGGTNRHDDTVYEILLQIIANDQIDRDANYKTLLKWQQTARRSTAFNNFANVISGTDGCVYNGTSLVTKHLDKRKWALHDKFWSGILCKYWAREPRS